MTTPQLFGLAVKFFGIAAVALYLIGAFINADLNWVYEAGWNRDTRIALLLWSVVIWLVALLAACIIEFVRGPK